MVLTIAALSQVALNFILIFNLYKQSKEINLFYTHITRFINLSNDFVERTTLLDDRINELERKKKASHGN